LLELAWGVARTSSGLEVVSGLKIIERPIRSPFSFHRFGNLFEGKMFHSPQILQLYRNDNRKCTLPLEKPASANSVSQKMKIPLAQI